MYRKRRRSRGIWFPNLGTAAGEGQNSRDDDLGIWAQITIPKDGTSINFITSLTFDHYVDEGATETGINSRSLADFNQSEYILKRIVGKLFLALDQFPLSAARPFAALVTAAFLVAREDENPALANAAPMGGTDSDELRDNFSPASAGTSMEPYIWRRRWILGNQSMIGTEPATAKGMLTFPPNNTLYGSVWDGPHIDSKTKRRVAREDRLWFIISARALSNNWQAPFAQTADNDTGLSMHLDYRLFGVMVRPRRKGTF